MHRTAVVGLSCSLFLSAASLCSAQAPVTPLVIGQREDAAINDVYFLDARHGWAVGERGAIWRTDDGGLRWSQSESGVSCGLSSVCFLDEQRGWAAGGWTEPYTHLSHGVVLTTDDGGHSWQALNRTLLPAVRQIQFFSPTRGIAVGRTSPHAAAGVFVTDDGGRSWSPLSSDVRSTWLAAGLTSTDSGLLVGCDGVNATLAGRSLRHGKPVGDRLRGLTAVKLIDQRQAWGVGEGGLLVQTTDAGKTWQTHAGRLPAGAEACDFAAIEIVGDHVWIAGSPGSRLLHSTDRGKTFHWQSSGQSVPLRAIQFVDPRRGWAVGGLGTILATSDGGVNWRRQRGGGERAAWLAVVDRADRLPLEMIAQLSAGEGYLGVVHTIVRDDLEVPEAADPNRRQREREALIAAGASHADAAWQFPARQPGLRLSPERIVDVWKADGQPGAARLEEHLVRQLRIWQPQVVVTHAASPRGENPLGHVINQ
ncbi:MAG: YCF48-related protein, partial [Pirellulales bacterium]